MSKLGPHCLKPTDTAQRMVEAGAKIVKLVDDFGLAERAQTQGALVIGRSYSRLTAEAQFEARESPADAARRFVESQRRIYELNPLVKLWEGHNEPVWSGPEQMDWYAGFEIARIDRMAGLGLRCVIGNFSTGSPDLALWPKFVPAVKHSIDQGGVLGLHEYSAPWVWWMTGRFQLNPGEDGGDEGWTTLRYRKVLRDYLIPAKCKDVQIAVTEFGLDRVGPVQDGMPTGNWRACAGWWGKHSGQGDPIDYWRGTERDPEGYYAEQLIWYDREIQKDAQVLGAVIFTVGSNDPAWDGHDIAGTRAAERLIAHIASAKKEDARPMPSPKKPKTRAETGPAQATNLLSNGSLDAGHAHWHNIPEIVIPDGFDFWYAPRETARVARQDHDWFPPECVVWNKRDAPAYERSLFFLSGDYCLKVFKGWGPIWWRLIQQVKKLTPGRRYVFTAPVFPDLVMKYDEKKGKIFADDPLAGEVRLTARSGGKLYDTGWLNGSSFKFGAYTEHILAFTAEDSTAELSLECRGRWGLANNGFFVDSLRLEAVGAPVPVPQPLPAQPPLPTPPGDLRKRLKQAGDDLQRAAASMAAVCKEVDESLARK